MIVSDHRRSMIRRCPENESAGGADLIMASALASVAAGAPAAEIYFAAPRVDLAAGPLDWNADLTARPPAEARA